MKLNSLNKLTGSLARGSKMPVLFLGHGSPMNAIEDNEFVRSFKQLGKELPKPKAILCISAHWETRGTRITAMEKPKTIHDFRGFPQQLFNVSYPAPGSPDLAKTTRDTVQKAIIELDRDWGLDHGAWSVLTHLYPMADVPVVQLSLDYTLSPQEHAALAKELAVLRYKGVLIVGSGNIVHNLGKVAWDKLHGEPYAYDWAVEANERIKGFVTQNDLRGLTDFRKHGKAFDLAIPTPEHYLPLLYTAALREENDDAVFFNDAPVGGSLTMTSVKFG